MADDPNPDEPIYLIDGHGYIFRAYYAVRQLSTSKGFSTNAIFGFCNMLLKVLRERKPKYLAIAFDPGGKNFRHEMYPAYKATRSPAPEDLPPQIPLIQEVVDHFQIHRLMRSGVEADDLLGTVAREYAGRGYQVRIITGDKDLYQLVDDKIQLIDDMRAMRGGDTVKKPEVDREEVIKKFGVPPGRVIDVLALAGDTSDNVPGVKGIGVKTAAQLVETYGDLDAILAAAPEIKQKARRQRLLDHADDARLSRDLVTIRCDLDLEVSLDQLSYQGPDLERVRAFFEEYELKRLLTDPIVRGENPSLSRAPRPTSRRAPQGQADMFSAPGLATETEAIDVDRGHYVTVCDEPALQQLATNLNGAETLGVTTLLDAGRDDADVLVGLGLSWSDGEGAYIPLGHAEDLVFPAQLSHSKVADLIGPILAAQDKAVAAAEGKATIGALVGAGFGALDLEGDPAVASYLLDPEANGHEVNAVARRRFGYEALTRQDLTGKGKGAKPMREIDVDQACALAAEHADLTRRLHPVLEEALEQAEMTALYHQLEMPLSRTLAKMESAGLLIDQKVLLAMGQDFKIALADIEKRAHEAAGEPFNLGSPKQIAELLFETLKLKIVKRTATGPSTDSQVLEQLKHEHAIPGLILEHRTVAKLKNTYVDVLPKIARQKSGRVHTRFNQTVAATGRLSSSDPNLQNIPARTELGRKIRSAFIAPAGSKLISLDYSQIELRILAHVSGDAVLVEAFKTGEDVHRRTASELFDVAVADVSREQRSQAKTINFGLLYGMGVLRLGRELGLKRAEAKAYLQKYFDRLQGLNQWRETALKQAHEDGFVRTLFGRRRLLPGLQSANRGEVARAERLAINTPIQGSAADMIKRAMIDADYALTDQVPGAKLLLQVHDELLIEAPDDEVEKAMSVVKDAMMQAAKILEVPMIVDAKAAQNWADAH